MPTDVTATKRRTMTRMYTMKVSKKNWKNQQLLLNTLKYASHKTNRKKKNKQGKRTVFKNVAHLFLEGSTGWKSISGNKKMIHWTRLRNLSKIKMASQSPLTKHCECFWNFHARRWNLLQGRMLPPHTEPVGGNATARGLTGEEERTFHKERL